MKPQQPAPHSSIQHSRRGFFQRLGGILGAGAALAGITMVAQAKQIEVCRYDLPISNAHPDLIGLRIGQISDLHASAEVPAEHIQHAIELVQAEAVDLITITGDFISTGRTYVPGVIDAVAALQAPLGVYAVLGNRDHSSEVAELLTNGLTKRGIEVLRNRAIRLQRGQAQISLVGVDDLLMNQAKPEQAFADLADDDLRVLLVHEPDFADQAPQYAVDLQLSGHSHGGQVRLPLIGALRLPALGRRYQAGFVRVPQSRTWVHTNRGIGTIPPHVRFNCRPEVSIFRVVTST